ncbi:MAG: leucine-rich repeat domain-containing protein [Mogibacterium sp.]|nr:leucine-rich repeat domain-containing protein [Mogibacterium sp.]
MPTLMLKESLISFDSPVERYTVPPMIRRIAANAFYDKGRLVHLTIPDNVVEIGDFAFKMCFNMNRLDLPARVEKFGIGMFQQCRKLEVVVLPEGVREIDPGMFVCCDSLRSVTIPQSVEKISPHAFTTSHELREIVIPPENLHLLPESRRSIAAITYMKRHISDGGSSVIDAFVRQDPAGIATLAVRQNEKDAIRYMTEHRLLSSAEIGALVTKANDLKRTEIAAMLLEANRQPEGTVLAEELFEWDPFA